MSGDDAQTPRRRRRFGWVIALVVVIVVLAGAAVAGEWIARSIATDTVRTQAADGLGVEDPDTIEVEIPGLLLPQLLGGTIGEATVRAPQLRTAQFAGDATLTVHDLVLGDAASIAGGSATVALDAAQLRSLMSGVDGFPADTIGLDAPNVTAAMDLRLLGLTTTVGIALTPGVDAGMLTLTPDALRIGDGELTAQTLRARFGALADAVLQDWRVCIATQLPETVHLAAVDVVDDRMVARFDIDAGPLTEAALAGRGSCA